MRVKVTKKFRWSPEGNGDVLTFMPGMFIQGRAAVVCLELQSGEVMEDGPKPDAPSNRSATPPKNRSTR